MISHSLRSGAFSARPLSLARIIGASIVVGGMFVSSVGVAQDTVKPGGVLDPRRQHDAAPLTAEPRPQDDPTGVHDADRTIEAYQPKGIDLGEFLLLPAIEFGEALNTNVYAENRSAKADFISSVAPEFRLQSRFDTHSLNFYGKAEQFMYHSFTRDNHLDGNLAADGRIDVTKTAELGMFVNLFSRSEDRSSPDEAKGKTPTQTRGLNSRTSAKNTVGNFLYSVEVTADRNEFDNVTTTSGTVVQNRDRDRWEGAATGRVGYEIFPSYYALMQYSENMHRYDNVPNSKGLNRDSEGYSAQAGIGVDISQLIRGDFLVGYMEQNYKTGAFSNPSGVSFRSQFNWTPDKLTLVVPALERSVKETTTDLVGGMVETAASLLIRHELERNIILTASGGVTFDQYEGIQKEAYTYDWRLKGTYVLVPEAYFSGEVAQKFKRSQIGSSDFDQTLVMMRLGLRL